MYIFEIYSNNTKSHIGSVNKSCIYFCNIFINILLSVQIFQLMLRLCHSSVFIQCFELRLTFHENISFTEIVHVN